jgi:uncharacterized protein
MIIEGSYEFPASRETVYEVLQDPDVLVKALPGAKSLTRVADGKYEGIMSVGVGPVSASAFDMKVELHDRVPPERFSMRIDGKGPIGFARGNANVSLSEANGITTMRYQADLQVGGRIAGVGQRLLDSASRTMTRQGLESLSRELQRRLAPAVGIAAEEAAGRSRIARGRVALVVVAAALIAGAILYVVLAQ